MSSTTNELAMAMKEADRVREASWNGARYRLSCGQAAARAGADPVIRAAVIAMLRSGYADFPAWTDETLNK